MSKKPRIEHSYSRHKDRMKISIRGYELSKLTRGEIIENLVREVERSPDRLVATARKSKAKAGRTSPRGLPKVSRLVEVGD